MDLTPYVIAGLGLVAAVTAWLFKQVIQSGKDVVELKTAFKYYLERTGIDSARILAGSPNPTPPEMQELLKKYPDVLNEEERSRLIAWLKSVIERGSSATKGEQSIALQLLASMDTMQRLAK